MFERELRQARSFRNALMPDQRREGFSPLRERSSPQQQLCTHLVSRDAIDPSCTRPSFRKSDRGLHHARQLLETCRGTLRIANDVLTR